MDYGKPKKSRVTKRSGAAQQDRLKKLPGERKRRREHVTREKLGLGFYSFVAPKSIGAKLVGNPYRDVEYYSSLERKIAELITVQLRVGPTDGNQWLIWKEQRSIVVNISNVLVFFPSKTDWEEYAFRLNRCGGCYNIKCRPDGSHDLNGSGYPMIRLTVKLSGARYLKNEDTQFDDILNDKVKRYPPGSINLSLSQSGLD